MIVFGEGFLPRISSIRMHRAAISAAALTRCVAWLLVVSLLLIPFAARAEVEFLCAPETQLHACSAGDLWRAFEREADYEHSYASEDWLRAHLSARDVKAFRSTLDDGTMLAPEWGARRVPSSPALELTLRWLSGTMSAPEVARAARSVEDARGRTAVISALTLLDREPALVSELLWTIDSEHRDLTSAWLLRARHPRAVSAALAAAVTESQDSHFHAGELWPDETLFTLSQLQRVWPMTSVRYRAAIVSRMPALGLEPYLRTVLTTDDDGVALENLVDAAIYNERGVRFLLGRLALERLAAPAAGDVPRFAAPIVRADGSSPELPFRSSELTGLDLMISPESAALMPLWTALADHRNDWIALYGVAALIHLGADEQASMRLAQLWPSDGIAPEALRQLLMRSQSPESDRIYRAWLDSPGQHLACACSVLMELDVSRADRLILDINRWAKRVLGAAAADPGLAVENMDVDAPKSLWPSPLREVTCVLDVLKRSAPKARPESLEIAHWLEGQDVEFYQLAGATISANNGDPAGLRRVITKMANDTHPVRKRVRWEMQQLLQGIVDRGIERGG